MSSPAVNDQITALKALLVAESTPLGARFRALFSLKHLASLPPSSTTTTESAATAVEAISAAFTSSSALLKHEVAYCLGQTRNKLHAAPVLRRVLQDVSEDAMVRHESAEALGALGDRDSLELLEKLRDDETEVSCVRETCELAIDRIEWESGKKGEETVGDSNFASIDPAPSLPQTADKPDIDHLQQILLNTKLPLFERYRAMFSLRELSSPPDLPSATPAVIALSKGLKDPSALFRHEIAFVFGQLCHPASIPCLVETLSDVNEESMVRHEAAEALGSLGGEPGVEDVLKKFLNDRERVVRESVIVALDMAEFENSGEAEYAIIPNGEAPSVVAANA